MPVEVVDAASLRAMTTVVFFHAHPDDEAIATGGTMVGLSRAGHRVVLVTATRGELGEIPDDLVDKGESLADRRKAELTEACRILGVGRQVYLDYLDSGMAGEASNERPGSFAAADVEEAARALADVLVEEAADVLVTYDEHGGYGHPDHVQVHRVGIRAAELAATPVVYMATMNRDFVREVIAQAAASDVEIPEPAVEGADTMGEPEGRLTTEVDVGRWLEREAPGDAGPRQSDRRDQLLPLHARRHVRQGVGPRVVHPGPSRLDVARRQSTRDRTAAARPRPGGQDSVNACMDTTRLRPVSLAR